MISPCLSCVRALNDLQNSMMFTPCWPSAGPTGGDGVAAPAGHCSFSTATSFWAPLSPLAGPRGRPRAASPSDGRSGLLHVGVIEHDRGGPAEHLDPQP